MEIKKLIKTVYAFRRNSPNAQIYMYIFQFYFVFIEFKAENFITLSIKN